MTNPADMWKLWKINTIYENLWNTMKVFNRGNRFHLQKVQAYQHAKFEPLLLRAANASARLLRSCHRSIGGWRGRRQAVALQIRRGAFSTSSRRVESPLFEFPRLTSSRTNNVSSLRACSQPPFWKVTKTQLKPHSCMPNECFTKRPEVRRLRRRRPTGSRQNTCFTVFKSLGHQKRGVSLSRRRDGSDGQACRMIGSFHSK